MTNKACVQTPRDTYLSEELYYNSYAHGMQFINPQITRNLNRGDHVNGGKLFKFQDSGSNVHHVSMVTIMGAGNAKQKTQVTIFQGSDIANPTNSYSVTFDAINPSFAGEGQKLKVKIQNTLWNAVVTSDSPYDPQNEKLRS